MNNTALPESPPKRLVEQAAEILARRMDPDRLLDKHEAADLFGCAPRTFAEKVAVRPGFPKAKTPGRWMNSELRAWLNQASH